MSKRVYASFGGPPPKQQYGQYDQQYGQQSYGQNRNVSMVQKSEKIDKNSDV